ncbi:NUDIX domain-containing protein [Saccharopolyspora sp. NPDC003752]
MTIRLLSVDVGKVVAAGRSLRADLRAASDLPAETVAHCVRSRLHAAPEITRDVIAAVAGDLCLSPETVDRIVHGQGDLRVDPAAVTALRALRRWRPELKIVLNSNVCSASAHQTEVVAERFKAVIDGYYRSYQTGYVKGLHYQAFTQIARDFRVNVDEIVHLDDKPSEVDAALKAGCRGMLVNPRHTRSLANPPAADDRFRSAATIRDAEPLLRKWITKEDDKNPTLAVRGQMLIRDQDERILTVRARGQKKSFLPGGRCHDYFPEDPARTAMREVKEELGIILHAAVKDVRNVAWSPGDSRRDGRNKIVYTVDGGYVDQDEITIVPKRDEVEEYQWVTLAEAEQLLHPREHERVLDVLEHKRLITFQQ